MDERSKRAQMERKRRIRRKKQRRRVLISALVEVLILAVLAFAFCWNRGLETKISGFFGRFDRPPVKDNIINLRKKWKGICSQVPFIVLKYRQGCI